MLSAEAEDRVDNTLRDLHNSSHHTNANSIIFLLFIQNIPSFKQANLLVDFLLNFIGTNSGYKQMLFHADTPQKVDSIHRTIFSYFVFGWP